MPCNNRLNKKSRKKISEMPSMEISIFGMFALCTFYTANVKDKGTTLKH